MELSKRERTLIYIALHKRLRVYQKELDALVATGRPFKGRKAYVRSQIKETKDLMDKMGVTRR